jgi:hypothetical protein
VSQQGRMSLAEAASHLKISEEKVEMLARRGSLPGLFAQGSWSFAPETVERYGQRNAGSGPVPAAWQVPTRRVGAPSSAAALGDTRFGGPAQHVRPAPAPRMVNESVPTQPPSLELDLSILDRLEIPEPPDEEP